MRRAALVLAGALALAGAIEVGAAAWIHAKGFVAQRLIAIAWRRSDGGKRPIHPWPRADLRPVARLTVPARHVELYVMDDASRRSLAFGPGLVAGTATQGSAGNTVIVAHRDTHFTFLKRLSAGDEIDLQAASGRLARYRVTETAVVDRTDTEVMEDEGRTRLTLITCYPFDALRPGTRLRYVVVAARVG
ncbi:MAG TPA: class GN sortase [Usitatibacter sp.]|nr:class GN sortase [Usitatibacter sp.]